ncbi:MAG: hypothetical protein OEN56_01160 [Gemmatimonadota bacterium]|nr:hypothetical protein [Gemmatimonadota bacterium]
MQHAHHGTRQSLLTATRGVTTAVCLIALGCGDPSGPEDVPDGPSLAFVMSPSSAEAGETLTSVQVEIRGPSGTRDTSASGSVALELVGGSPGAVLDGTQTVAAVDGVAMFDDLLIERAGTGYSLTATASGAAAAVSAGFDVVAAAAVSLEFRGVSSEVAIGAEMGDLEVVVEDAFGNPITSADPVSVELLFDPAGDPAVLGGLGSAAPVAGVADFASLRMLSGGRDLSLRATFGALETESGLFDAYLPFTEITAGSQHTCGIADEHATPAGDDVPPGVVYCWGYNEYGQTAGAGPTVGRPQVVRVAPSGAAYQAKAVAAGRGHTCSIDLSGEAVCWGQNHRQQLGVVVSSLEAVPTPIGSSERFREIEAGGDHTCAITEMGELRCWGDNEDGQIRYLTRTTPREFSTPTAPFNLSQAWAVALGPDHTCATGTPPESDAVVTCRGLNGSDQIGTPDPITGVWSTSEPDLMTLATVWTHTCGLTAEGEAHCWGADEGGQLGDGIAGGFRAFPDTVHTGLRFAEIVAGASTGTSFTGHTCALTAEGEVYCWGENSGHVFGVTSPASSALPVRAATNASRIEASVSFARITAGRDHMCGLSTSGRAYCWGSNTFGEVGLDIVSAVVVKTPLPILWPTVVVLP